MGRQDPSEGASPRPDWCCWAQNQKKKTQPARGKPPPSINVKRRPLTQIEKTPESCSTLTQGCRNLYRNPCESGPG